MVEIAFKIVDLKTGEQKESFQQVISHPADLWEKSDQESLKVNGFTWDEISQGASPKNASQKVIDLFSKWGVKRGAAVFICQNPSFDRVFFSQLIDPDTQELLNWPYHWLDLASMHWALTMNQAILNKGPFPWETGFSKDLIAAHHKLPKEEKPHRAMNGVRHLLLCYEAVVGFPESRLHPS